VENAERFGIPAPGSRRLLFATAYATAASVLGAAPGFLIPIAAAAVFGADARTDAFFLALAAATLVVGAIGTTTQQAAIPFLVAARQQHADVGRLVGELTTMLVLLAAVPAVALSFGLPLFVQYQSGWTEGETRLLSVFLWSLLPYAGLAIVAAVYSGALNAEHRFGAAAASPAVRSFTVLMGIAVARWLGILGLVGGYLFGELLRTGYLLFSITSRYRVRLLAWPRSMGAREYSRTAAAQALGSGLLSALPLVDRTMASGLEAGSITVFEYAERLWQIPVALAVSGFMVTSLAHWSQRLERGGSLDGLARDTARVAMALALLCTPVAAVVVEYRGLVAEALFGSLRPDEAARLADVLGAFVGVLPVYVAGLVYTRAFLILRRSDLLLAINIVQVVMKLGGNALLMPLFGLVGLALSTAFMYVVATIGLVTLLHGGSWQASRSSQSTAGAPS
jgi:putative peptidoglycan lipid II flippase